MTPGDVAAGKPAGPDRLCVTKVEELWFGPGDPVRAASGVARLGDGWLVAQDDAVHAAWWRPPFGLLGRLRLLPSRDELDVFSEAAGTKHLKPDLETACSVTVGGHPAVLLLGSGSLAGRTWGVLVQPSEGDVLVQNADLAALYARVGEELGLDAGQVNLEGACIVGERLRWFQRGHGRSGVPSASIDLDLAALVTSIVGRADPAAVPLGAVRRYDLGVLDGCPLAITDAVPLPDGRVCVAATAEDAPDAVADGPVTGSALALLGDHADVQVLSLPSAVATLKVEGLAVAGTGDGTVELLAVVDQDDPEVASLAVHLLLRTDGRSPRRQHRRPLASRPPSDP